MIDHYEVVRKLIGPINTIGETNYDDRAFKSLEDTIALVDKLIFDISRLVPDSNLVEFSCKRSGKKAKEFLTNLKDELPSETNDVLESDRTIVSDAVRRNGERDVFEAWRRICRTLDAEN